MAIERFRGILEIDTRRGQIQFFKEIPLPDVVEVALTGDECIEHNKLLTITGLGRLVSKMRISIQHMKGVSFFR